MTPFDVTRLQWVNIYFAAIGAFCVTSVFALVDWYGAEQTLLPPEEIWRAEKRLKRKQRICAAEYEYHIYKQYDAEIYLFNKQVYIICSICMLWVFQQCQ